MFFKKKGRPDKKTQEDSRVEKAKALAVEYGNVEGCELLLDVLDGKLPENYWYLYPPHGWIIGPDLIEGAGISIDEVYDFIQRLALKRKEELIHSLPGLKEGTDERSF